MTHDPNKALPTAPPFPTKPDGFMPFTPAVDPAAIALRTLDVLNTTTATLRDLHAENTRLSKRIDDLTQDLTDIQQTAHDEQRAADRRAHRLEQAVVTAIAAADRDYSDERALVPNEAIEALQEELRASQSHDDPPRRRNLDIALYGPVPGLTTAHDQT